MNEIDKIGIKEVFKTLTLFFALSVLSLVLFYSKFEQGVEDFWQNNEEYAETIENSGIYEIIDLDNVKTERDVYEIDKKSIEEGYVRSKGELNVFKVIFEEYARD